MVLPAPFGTLYLSAFSAPRVPASRSYYDRKRAKRKSHKHALYALARRRIDLLFAMLRNGTLYDPEHTAVAWPTAYGTCDLVSPLACLASAGRGSNDQRLQFARLATRTDFTPALRGRDLE